MIPTLLQIALGGGTGAVARYLVGLGVTRIAGPGMPLGVMTANILGSFLIGAFVVLAAHKSLTHLSPLVVTGFLGGFTTFSSFSLETVTLIERGQTGTAALYVLLSVGASLGALFLGLLAARGIFA
ncbi:fluoride efflux transporter CrcB [Oceaniglobus roseus]|uniref:fluoride efflux transporter CrcB n=1 Tax=Oceaniglobus roseus TaxID=1737570 RepID=UPI000C7E8C83|nr:fluoride efflux transporter CrcB [Kandeliimicrobium roseum]